MQTKKKIGKRKSQSSWYRRDPAFISIIQFCVDQNLSETSSLKLIEKNFLKSR